MSKIRELPEQEERVETGPIRFGDDWTGLFIRGDQAAYIANTLRIGLNHQPAEHPVLQGQIENLIDMLESCNETQQHNE